MTWWASIFGCPESERKVTQDLLRVRRLTDMNLAETCNAHRVFLDGIEKDVSAKSAIDDLVESMRKRAGREGSS